MSESELPDFASHNVHGFYVLNDKGEPVPEPSLRKWAQANFGINRHVGTDIIDGVMVSTIFTGMDVSSAFSLSGKNPVLWETMIFPGAKHDGAEWDQTQERCSGGREQAEAMHAKWVRIVKQKLGVK